MLVGCENISFKPATTYREEVLWGKRRNRDRSLYCPITDQIWLLFSGSQMVLLNNTADNLRSWIRTGSGRRKITWWNTIQVCRWTIWKERDLRCFKDENNHIQKMKG